ncbi:pre-piRNA 3'-exonuclease trimmer-like isoform X2 [Odontomachus brunneus]|uniref:pre-piRNA 3'-exonuclease trimmer-like isoform X2 n=1 Tax=Odontomachus brunneus TaxID=486640 RepID=UPI0013F27A28|nr:pre-piRNA 3'-exonuclease trimmer-like isoform X2 [Odontomachus brunneus]
MIEVTKQNFKEIYPILEDVLKNATFISFDLEFSGIETDNIRNSLFDSIEERYDSIRNTIQPYIIVQCGITAFEYKFSYDAVVFNFFLLPKSIPSKNRRFLWNVSTLEFLSEYEFDFNKFVHNGISYIDEEDEEILRQQVQDDTLLYNIEQHISFKEKDELKYYINQISKWLSTTTDETSSFKINTSTPSFQYLMHKKLRKLFPCVWTCSGDKSITVIKVQPDIKESWEKEEGPMLENTLIESYISFSKVFKLLVTLKKPMVGHNALLDLMFIHQQFYKPLPRKYIDFKNNIHKLFPIIYDTKFISFNLWEVLEPKEKWKQNSLGCIYTHFVSLSNKNNNVHNYSPYIGIVHKTIPDQSEAITKSMKCHTAGWDAYFTGYIFIKMAFTYRSISSSNQTIHAYRDIDPYDIIVLISYIKRFENCINISRSNISYLKLDGPDPVPTRANWLYVKSLTSKPITETEICKRLSKFGSVDARKITSKCMLVAVRSQESAQKILYFSKEDLEELYIVPYNAICHSPSIRLFFWKRNYRGNYRCSFHLQIPRST